MKPWFIEALFLALSLAIGWGSSAGTSAQESGSSAVQSGTPSDAELHALGERVIAAQHQDDRASDEYERIERHTMLAGSDRHTVDDKTYRVVPTGTGTLKLLVKDGATQVNEETYRKELRDLEQVLVIASNPNDPREQAVVAKWQKRTKDRKELVDAASRAYRASWGGHESRDGRLLDVLLLEPSPSFQPHSVAEEVLAHARAKVWIDDASGHLVRGEAEIISDVSIGAGIIGKLYRGGRVSLDNKEVAPGVWLASRIQYDFAGRKFFFTFESHEITETSRYRRVGLPAQTLALVRNELARGAIADP